MTNKFSETLEHGMGWLQSPPDSRDYTLHTHAPRLLARMALPSRIDFRQAYTGRMTPVLNQGPEGSCTGFGSTAIFQVENLVSKKEPHDGAEAFVYYNARLYQGWQNQDTGAYIRDAIKGLAQYGICEETFHPYIAGRYADRPSQNAYDNGKIHQALQYISVPNNEQQIKTLLAMGHPVVFGMTVYENYTAGFASGMWPMPSGRVVGGHCMAFMGYDDISQLYLVKNSWGVSVGDKGWFYIPYQYIAQNASDMWVIEKVSGIDADVPEPEPEDPTEQLKAALKRMIDDEDYKLVYVGDNDLGQATCRMTLNNGEDPDPPIWIAITR